MKARRIFVVGVPRSGTTLVQSLLAAHSELTSFTESHFFSRHFKALPMWPAAILTKDPTPRLREFLEENGFDSPGELVSLTQPPLGPWLESDGRSSKGRRAGFVAHSSSVARQFLSLLDEMAQRRDMPGWVEKTPRHLHFIPFLERIAAAPPLQFVHVVREGLAAVASLHAASRNWSHPYDLETCIDRWNSDVALSLSYIAEPAHHFILYEELTAHPARTLERLIAELGLDWQPQILDDYRSTDLVTADETWKHNVDHGIRPATSSASSLTAAQQQEARGRLYSTLYSDLQARSAARHQRLRTDRITP